VHEDWLAPSFLDQVEGQTVSNPCSDSENESLAAPANRRSNQALWQPCFGIFGVACNSGFKPGRKVIAPINDTPTQLAVNGPIAA
jgi:hypothetical protein